MDTSSGRSPHVVVGVDGSPASYAALRWAVRHARLTGATVDAVAAYELPGAEGWSAPAADADLDAAQTKATLAKELRTALVDDGDVPVKEHLVRGSPAKALIAASADADLLVVGSRGRGGFARLLLGSVSQQCALHAACPVVIVRPDTLHGEGPAAQA